MEISHKNTNISIQVVAPDNLDPKLINVLVQCFSGAIEAISRIKDKDKRREILLRYLSSTLFVTTSMLKALQVSKMFAQNNTRKIVEELLNNLHK